MGDKTAKLLRKQIRNVVQEILPEVMKTEVISSIHKDVAIQVGNRLDVVTKNMAAAMEAIDTRSKEVQSYMLRQSAQATPEAAAAIAEEVNKQ